MCLNPLGVSPFSGVDILGNVRTPHWDTVGHCHAQLLLNLMVCPPSGFTSRPLLFNQGKHCKDAESRAKRPPKSFSKN